MIKTGLLTRERFDSDKEFDIYKKLWVETIANWKQEYPRIAMSGELIGAYDTYFLFHIKRICSGKFDDTIEKTLDAVNKQLKMIAYLKPELAIEKKKKESNSEIEISPSTESERRYKYSGREMSASEYKIWYDGLTQQQRADILPKLEILTKTEEQEL